jgi:hypothetical protein
MARGRLYGGAEREVLRNHLHDYALKIYYKYALGVDFNEYVFPLENIVMSDGNVSGGLGVSSAGMVEDYDNLINDLVNRYPAANIDQELASELFRSIKILAAHPVYALKDKVKRTIYPNKFDRIMSMFLNEKDFILYTEAYDQEFTDIYKTTPNFSYTSKIARPDFKNILSGQKLGPSKYLLPNGLAPSSAPLKYKHSCQEDFPEVFSLYATITLLLPGSN